MNPDCFRCGHPAFRDLKIEATIGATRLKVGGEAADAGICAPCMMGLAAWWATGGESAERYERIGDRR